MDINLQNELTNILREIGFAKKQLTALNFQADLPSSIPGQYIGKPIPTRIGGEVTVLHDSLVTRHEVKIQISDGDYFAKSIHFNFKLVPLSRWLDINDFTSNYQDFYWGYKITGSERERQNILVPSWLINTAEQGNAGFFELVPQDSFKRGSTVTVQIEFFYPPNGLMYDTVVWAGFNGFYILN